jgi:hypothetical protein
LSGPREIRKLMGKLQRFQPQEDESQKQKRDVKKADGPDELRNGAASVFLITFIVKYKFVRHAKLLPVGSKEKNSLKH